MAEVAASVAIVEAANPPPAPTPAVQNTAAKTVQFGDGRTVNFSDDAPAVDPGDAILDEVLGGEAPAEGEKPAEGEADEDKTPLAKPAKPEEKPPEAPANDIEAAKLRKGFAKLAEERQKLVEAQNTARAATAAAGQYREKAEKHDALVASIEKDPAAFLLAHGGEPLVQKALQGFIDMEKPAGEREAAKLRAEWEADKKATKEREEQRQREQVVENWRNDIVGKVKSDERFDLVNSLDLHADVIGVITKFYEVHSERDHEGKVTKPAILQWDVAAQAVEDARAAKLESSKRYGKRTPAAATPQESTKDAPPAKTTPAPAKKAPTSLSSVPVAESPASADDLPSDDNAERERRLLAELFG